jgi:hypothetical protein
VQVVEAVQLAGQAAAVRVERVERVGVGAGAGASAVSPDTEDAGGPASCLVFTVKAQGGRGVHVFKVRFAACGGIGAAWHCSDCLTALHAYGVRMGMGMGMGPGDDGAGAQDTGKGKGDAHQEARGVAGMVRLCLLDESFPAFVAAVDRELAAAMRG